MTNTPRIRTNDLVEQFNAFIKKWTGDSYPHLIDSDENDGERFRELLVLERKRAEGLVRALELVSSRSVNIAQDPASALMDWRTEFEMRCAVAEDALAAYKQEPS